MRMLRLALASLALVAALAAGLTVASGAMHASAPRPMPIACGGLILPC